MLTPETLRPVLTDACQRLDEWRQADFPTKGTLDQPIREKFTELAELLNTDSVHPDCWQLTLAGDELVSQFGQWIDSVGGMDPIVIDAAAEVEKASTHEPREEERLESLEDILLRGRSHSDAARAWRWFAIDQDGKVVPDVARVAVALAYPSAPRVPGPNPRVIRQQLELEARWEARRRSRASAQPRKCPETLEQLLEQGVSFKQITKMTGKTPDEITAVAIELGHLADPDRPKSRFAPPPEVLLDRIDSHQELGSDLRARVLAMAADGHSPGTIVQVCHRNGFREASLRLLEAWLKPKVEAQA